ncbi:hypothetical protein V8E36_004641 [Tilletia maclaganii]
MLIFSLLPAAAVLFAGSAVDAAAAASANNNNKNRLSCQPWSLLDTPNAAAFRYADLRNNVYQGPLCSQVCSGVPQYYLSTNTSTGLVQTAGSKFSKAEKYIVEECAWPSLNIRTTLTGAAPQPRGDYYTPGGYEATLSTWLRIRRTKDPASCLTIPGLSPNASTPGAKLAFTPCDSSKKVVISQLFRFNLTTLYDGKPDKAGNPPSPPNNTRDFDFIAFQHFQRPLGQGKRTYFHFVMDGNNFKYVISKPQTRVVSDELPQFCIDGRRDRNLPYILCD